MTIAEALSQARQYHELGFLQQAEQLYHAILQADPHHLPAYTHLGNLLLRLGRPAEAAACHQQAIRLQRDYAEAYNDLGAALEALGRRDEAEAGYREAIRLKPTLVEAHNNLAVVLQQARRLPEAVACCREALRLAPDFAPAHSNLAGLLLALGQAREAADHGREAIRLVPTYAEAHLNLGNVLHDLGQADEAAACCLQALRLAPRFAEALSTLGAIWWSQGRLQEAFGCFEEALRCKPDFADAHLHRAMALLLAGDFERGWPEYEWRKRYRGFPPDPFPSVQPTWDGSARPGGIVLVRAEQGLGDTMQFVRYARLVKERVGRVVVECPAALAPLFKTCAGVDEVAVRGKPLPAFDAQVYMLSVPGLFGTNLGSIPANIPYLRADPALVERWRAELSRFAGFKVGIVWRGTIKNLSDRLRTIPLARFAPLARIPGVQLFSLQKGPGVEQMQTANAPANLVDLGTQMDEASGPFMDTAAVMMNLDLVITADTAAAHLAGALGVPVWIALPLVPHWPWLLHREDSLWYPSARLFRQKEFGNWEEVFERIAAALADRRLRLSARQATLQTDPHHVAALHRAGLIAFEKGRGDEAVKHLRAALRLKPDFTEALNDLSNILLQQGQFDEACAGYREVIRLRPDYAAAYSNLGDALRQMGRSAEAAALCRDAIRLAPDFTEAHNNLGIVLRQMGRSAEAETAFRDAIRCNPALAAAYNNLGNALADLSRLEEAAACYRQALRLNPDFAEAHRNLGIVLHDLEKDDEAEASCRQAIRLAPNFAEAHNTLGSILWPLGRLEEASCCFEETLRCNPDFVEAHLSRALKLLLTGDFERGWAEYEWRQRYRKFFPAPLHTTQPTWDGSALPEGAVLMRAEQGLGDAMQFIRYARLVKERVGRVVVECPAELAKLLKTCPGVDEVAVRGEPLPAFDAHVLMQSVPGLLGTRLSSIPADVPYLHADPALVESWRNELSRFTGFKVGIVWQGSIKTPLGRLRAIPLARFAPLAQVPGVRLFSLQKGAGVEQMQAAEAPAGLVELGTRLDEASGPFMDTAAVMKNLDLVITSDTAAAHLAGALGVPVWIALPLVPHWPWLLHREDSPWYPTARLFRQPELGNWEEVFERIRKQLLVLR